MEIINKSASQHEIEHKTKRSRMRTFPPNFFHFASAHDEPEQDEDKAILY